MRLRTIWLLLGVIAFLPGSQVSVLLGAPQPEIVPERDIIETDEMARTDVEIVDLADGDEYAISADPVNYDGAGTMIPGAYAYNGSIPGPVLRVPVGAEITVPFTNNLNEPTTIHWHGLRHDIRFDGVAGVSQDPVEPGETFEYQVTFPDEGVFWYHPHIREDRQQDLGLYGMIIVYDPEEGHYSGGNDSYDREEAIIINDIVFEEDMAYGTGERRIFPYGHEHTNMAMMGRFGGTVVVNGEKDYRFEAEAGEIVRYHILNVASARPYKVRFEGMPTRLVASDLSTYERAEEVDSVMVGPAERFSVDVFYTESGEVRVLHDAPLGRRVLSRVDVSPGDVDEARWEASWPEERELVDSERLAAARGRDPDYTLDLDIWMDWDVHGAHMRMMGGPLYQIALIDGIEWHDDHVAHNAMSTTEDIRWILREPDQALENLDIEMRAEPGDEIVIRIHNRADSDHPMHHPIHLHGQRFAVITKDRVPNDNLAWKDTVTVPVGETWDILVEVEQPGRWMIHCHIPEHMEAGMMAWLDVPDADGNVPGADGPPAHH